jgi:hypothetical protein
MKIYGLISDSGDGSSCIQWFRTKEKVDEILNDDSLEQYYANEGEPSAVLDLPDDLDLEKAGFDFWED